MESVYPAAGQLAIDMMVRLKNSADEICEILLSKNRVLAALQFASKQGLLNNEVCSVGLKARKFLDASVKKANSELQGDNSTEKGNIVFYSVYNFFKERNMLDRGCQEFKDLYQKLYP